MRPRSDSSLDSNTPGSLRTPHRVLGVTAALEGNDSGRCEWLRGGSTDQTVPVSVLVSVATVRGRRPTAPVLHEHSIADLESERAADLMEAQGPPRASPNAALMSCGQCSITLAPWSGWVTN